MTIEINSPKLTPGVATYGAFAVRKSDSNRWNNVAGAWQTSPVDADAFIALADRGGVNAGLYCGSNSGNMGDAGLVEITLHDSASSYALVAGTGAGTITVMGGDEVQTALVGSAMTLATDAVNAAALSADAVAEIADKITLDHGSGSYVDSGTGLDAAGVRDAVGLAAANLDTQIGALPTAVLIATAVWSASTRTLTGFGTLIADIWAGLTGTAANKIADHVRRRTQANVEASADGDALDLSSQYGMIQMAQESSRAGATLTVKQTDGITTLGTKTLTSSPTAEPITGVT